MKQKLASIVDRYPDVISEVRGEGLLIGLKAVVPAADLVGALRDDEKLLTVSAGENVVRLLPPLIVTEAEIEDAVARIERVCERASQAPARRGAAR
jgi:acetylornithine/N-succinyldiaminopimelate aminotransferase